jgi:uncharacterized Zn finger protein
MSYYGFAPYVSVGEKKLKAQKTLEKLKKKNPSISPIVIEGQSIAKTWWGKSWNSNLERYSDYGNRIGRGRSYVRNGAVLDLQITSGIVKALVQGSDTNPYKIEIKIKPLDKKNWKKITEACAGNFSSLEELISGKFPKALAELFNSKGDGLFPTPKEISFDCSCPDWADMCKHVAAALFGIGARLDEDPKLFFKLRNVNIEELISKTVQESSKKLIEKSKKKSTRIIENTDISDVFGIDLEDSTKKAQTLTHPSEKKKVAKKKIAKKKNLLVKESKKIGRTETPKSKKTSNKKPNHSSKEISILENLKDLYRKFVPRKELNGDSQLCMIWPMNPPDVLENTRQIIFIEATFNITIKEDEALELFDMSLKEASTYIQKLIELQK